MKNPFYVYSHWIVGSETPFYIGMSTKKECGQVYERAYRNSFASKTPNSWREFARQVAYTVKIEKDFPTRKMACEYEVFLIKKYGRIDLDSGTLINQTDGGLGIINPSSKIKSKITSARWVGFDSKSAILGQQPYAIEVHKYDVLGNYLESYVSHKEAARQNKTLASDIGFAVKGMRKVVAGFQWRSYKCIDGIGLPPPKKDYSKSIVQINFHSNEIVNEWNNAVEASKKLKISRSGIANCLSGISKSSGGFKWRYAA